MGELNALRTRDHAETSRQADGGDDRPTAAGDRRVREVLPDRREADPGRLGGDLRGWRLEDARLQGWTCLRGVSGLADRPGRCDAHNGGVGGRLNGGALSGDGRGDQDQGQQEDRVPITQGLGWLVDTSDWQVMTERYRSPLLPCPVMRCVTE
jgi:hypothetical protein